MILFLHLKLKMSPRTNSIKIFYDLESTGLNYFYDHIIEIGAYSDTGEKFQTFVKPPINIPPHIKELTHINDDMVKDAPDIQNALEMFINYICNISYGKKIYLIAHNGNNFDHPFLRRYVRQFMVDIPMIIWVDTIPISKHISPERRSHSLKNICKYYGIEQENAHRADDDSRCLMEVYNNMEMKYKELYGINFNINDIVYSTHI